MQQEDAGLHALQLLSADHRKVEELFEQFEKANPAFPRND
jgi:hypothetical protein